MKDTKTIESYFQVFIVVGLIEKILVPYQGLFSRGPILPKIIPECSYFYQETMKTEEQSERNYNELRGHCKEVAFALFTQLPKV